MPKAGFLQNPAFFITGLFCMIKNNQMLHLCLISINIRSFVLPSEMTAQNTINQS